MNKVFLAGLIALATANCAAFADEPRGQTDPMPNSKQSDWNNLMPNKDKPLNLPSQSIYSAPPSSTHVNTFATPESNPFQNSAPKIGIPNNATLNRAGEENTMQRITRHTHDAMQFAQQGSFDRALESIDKAIALDPRIDFLYSLRSHLYGKLGKPELAARDLQKFRELQNQKNNEAIEKWHQQQERDAGLPALRDRIKDFIAH